MYGIYSQQYDNWTKFYDPLNLESSFLNDKCDYTGKTVLDVGCGTGRLSFKFSKKAHMVVGIDIDKFSIDYCNKKKLNNNFYNCLFVNADATLYTTNIKFDIICFSWSLYQMDMDAALKNLLPLLNNNGLLLIMQPVGGKQEKIFDVELKKYQMSYDEIYNSQLLLCKKYFYKYEEHSINTYFEYNSVDEAISSNLFFYELFLNLTKKQKHRLIDKLKVQLSLNCIDGHLQLSDVTKVILCSEANSNEI